MVGNGEWESVTMDPKRKGFWTAIPTLQFDRSNSIYAAAPTNHPISPFERQSQSVSDNRMRNKAQIYWQNENNFSCISLFDNNSKQCANFIISMKCIQM